MKTVLAMLLALLVIAAVSVHARDVSETTKIQYLIASVDSLEGAKFIRNGREYDAKAASSHLSLKLKTAGDKVKTAEDFINLCASRSSMSGDPYFIRFADGATVKSETFFRDKLKAFQPGKQ